MADPRSVYITGANRGIGLALVREFATRGWVVFAGCRQPGADALDELAATEAVIPIRVDVTDAESVRAATVEIRHRSDCLDLLINNAGYSPGERGDAFSELDPEDLMKGFDVNVAGVARVTQSVLSLLEHAEQGKVVNMVSAGASVSANVYPQIIPYATTKAALNLLTRGMAASLLSSGMIVVGISPGWVRTELGGSEAPLTPEESAAALYPTIVSLRESQAGQLLNRDGSLLPE